MEGKGPAAVADFPVSTQIADDPGGVFTGHVVLYQLGEQLGIGLDARKGAGTYGFPHLSVGVGRHVHSATALGLVGGLGFAMGCHTQQPEGCQDR